VAQRDAAASYQSRAVETAPGPQVLVMLYDRLAVDIEVADRAIGEEDLFAANAAIQHAQQIVAVLRHSLHPEGFEGGDRLLAIYEFLTRHLVEANLSKSQAVLRECAAIVSPLRDAWRLAVAQPERTDVPAHVG
jgi:flagellar secretion chaperone FliS